MNHIQLLMLSTFITALTFAAHKEQAAPSKSKQSTETLEKTDCTQTATQTRSVSYSCNGVSITFSATATSTVTATDCTSASVGATVAAGITASNVATNAARAGSANCQNPS